MEDKERADYNIIREGVTVAFTNGIGGIGLYLRRLSIEQIIIPKRGH